MGRSPCCEKVGLKKGPWTPEEDQKLLAYIEEHGHGSWRALPAKAGLQRCGKSCRLRWTNYLRPDIKRGKFSLQEEQTIIQLHALLGNRWSAIATHLPKRTDNEIKNYWNTHLKKRLAKMGIDPVTHKPKNDALLSSAGDGQSKSAAKLSHMAQWESARLEAEARLVRESKLRSHSFHQGSSSSSTYSPGPAFAVSAQFVSTKTSVPVVGIGGGAGDDLESPTSTLTFSESAPAIMTTNEREHSKQQMIEFVGTTSSSSNHHQGMVKEEGEHDWKNSIPSLGEFKDGIENGTSLPFTSTSFHDITMSISLEAPWTTTNPTSPDHSSLRAPSSSAQNTEIEAEGFTDLLLNSSGDQSLSDSENGGDGSGGSDYYEDNKNYWNSILNLVNSSPSESPMF